MARNCNSQEWENKIKDFKASGMNQTQYCKVNNLKLHQFKYWYYKLEKSKTSPDQASKWVSISVDEKHSSTENDLLQVKVGETIIEVKPGFNQSLFIEVVKALKTIC